MKALIDEIAKIEETDAYHMELFQGLNGMRMM